MQPSIDSLSTTFSALADPTRRAILARLSSGETSVKELAQPFAMSLPAISKHLKVLEHAGLITRGREAQWRPCRLKAKPLSDVADWVEQYRRFWEESLDRLEEYLHELQAQQKGRQSSPASSSNPQQQSAQQLRTKEKDRKHASNRAPKRSTK